LNSMAQQEISNEPASNAAELMNRVQQGDMNAYQEIVRLYQRRVYRVISSYVRNPDDAMEVLQDTFLKVHTARHTWDKNCSFSGWIYRIAINAGIDRYRRSDRGRSSSLEDVMESQLHESATSRPGGGPMDSIRAGERRRALEKAVRRLPQRQREVVSLRYFGEMQLEEIATLLDCPLGTVKSNLHKAIMSLKAMLHAQKGVFDYE